MSNLNITADNHYTLKLVYKDADGFPIDLSGASAVFVLRRSMYSEVLIQRDADIEGVIGEININLVPDDTANILEDVNEETFIYGIQLTDANGIKRLIAQGKAVIQQNIVRV